MDAVRLSGLKNSCNGVIFVRISVTLFCGFHRLFYFYRRESTNSLGYSSLTDGKRPFAPRSPADVQLGDIVKFSRQGGKISRGTVRYIGHLPGKNDTYLGVELAHEIGKHDGIFNDQRYFQSKPNKGVFVAFTKVVMVWGE